MYSFFVLGQIPGTSITISFSAWLTLCLLAATSYLWVHVHRRKPAAQTSSPTISTD